MKNRATKAYVVELDGSRFRVSGDSLQPIDDLRALSGDIWLATDFQEGMSRVMTVEGPAKYAELLVRRKLQESGEFEEAVEILTHWKRRRGKNATEIFFTAVPSRLARFYLEELRGQAGISLVFSMYGVMWQQLKHTCSKSPMAVILRHGRFAEVLVASRERVYFANRCVAFDTEKEQLDALWATIQSDIETVEGEHRVAVGRVMRLNWLDAGETPDWPEEWQARIFDATPEVLLQDDTVHNVSWPLALKQQSALGSASPGREKLLHYAQKWAPLVNVGLSLVAALLLVGMMSYRHAADQLQQQTTLVRKEIGQVHLTLPREALGDQFDALLKFVGQLDRLHSAPGLQQIIADLTISPSSMLTLERLKVDYGAERIRLELHGKIETPFDRAHAGYQGFLNRLNALGYAVEESRFETEISTSQVVLKVTRPLI